METAAEVRSGRSSMRGNHSARATMEPAAEAAAKSLEDPAQAMDQCDEDDTVQLSPGPAPSQDSGGPN